jgi:prevent-host-death family protein
MSSPSIYVPLAEAKNRLSELVERVSRGEEFVITRHNAHIARLVPVRRPARQDVAAAIARMRATRVRRRATVNEIFEWRDEGRR